MRLSDILLYFGKQQASKLPPKPVLSVGGANRLPTPTLAEYEPDEPNVPLPDKAEYALDDGEYHPEEELLRADNCLRSGHGRLSRGAVTINDVDLALNGTRIPADSNGWFADKSIEKVRLGRLREGENVIEVVLPFRPRTNTEWCYLPGEFGVDIAGEYREPVQKPKAGV